MPAVPRLDATDSIGPENVSAAESGPNSATMSVSVLVVLLRVAEQPDQGDERDQHREEREQPVVGEGRCPIGEPFSRKPR